MKMNKKDKKEFEKRAWNRINEIEERIQFLSNKGVDYRKEMVKRKRMLSNLRTTLNRTTLDNGSVK